MAIVVLFIMTILFGAVGALMMKIGAGQLGTIQIDSARDVLIYMGNILTNITVLGGMAMYFLSAALWLFLLTKLDISVVQPILALTYVATPILAIIFIHESVPPLRWVGILVIILGVAIVARTAS